MLYNVVFHGVVLQKAVLALENLGTSILAFWNSVVLPETGGGGQDHVCCDVMQTQHTWSGPPPPVFHTWIKSFQIQCSLYLHTIACFSTNSVQIRQSVIFLSNTGVAYGNGGIARVARCLGTEFTQRLLLWGVFPRKKMGLSGYFWACFGTWQNVSSKSLEVLPLQTGTQ